MRTYGLSRVGVETGELTDEDIRYIDRQVVKSAQNAMVARQLFSVKRLADAGVKTWRQFKLSNMGPATIDMDGFDESSDRIELTPGDVKVPVISKSYKLFWRDIIASRRGGLPIDTLSAEEAASQVAQEEDKLLLIGEVTGARRLGIEGLATATGRLTESSTGAWGTVSNALSDLADAVAKIEAKQHPGPYALIVNSTYSAKLRAFISNTSTMAVEKLAAMKIARLLVSDNLVASDGDADNALIVEPGPENFEVGIGQDVTTYNWQDKDMTIHGKVYEVVTPYIKRADAICEITGLT